MLNPDDVRLLYEPALREARRRWPGLGAWVSYDPLKEPAGWAVGVHESTPHGAERLTLGRGGTPDRAFMAADRTEARWRLPDIHTSKTRREGYPYEIAGDLFDEDTK